MGDIDIIYDCLMSETYKNLAHLKIKLEDVVDQRLLRGFLTDLCIKHKQYGVNEKEMIEFTIDILDYEFTTDILDDYQHYREILIAVNRKSMDYNEFNLKVLKSLVNDETTEQNLKDILQDCDDIECIEYSKNVLLENEFYKYINILDDRIGELK